MDALSAPLSENAIVDQKMMSLRWVLGTSDPSVIGVADPNRWSATDASATRMTAGSHSATAPTLCSHFAMSRPRTLRPTASASPAHDATTKYTGSLASAAPCAPARKSALAAVKYNRLGKYGRLDVQ